MKIKPEDALNHVINQNKEFMNYFNESIYKLFNSDVLVEATQSNERHVKYVIFNNQVFVFDNINDAISLYQTKVQEHCFILNNINIDRIKNNPTESIYLPYIFKANSLKFGLQKVSTQFLITLNAMFDQGAISKEELDNLKAKFPEDSNSLSDKFVFSNNLNYIYSLLELLNSYYPIPNHSVDELIYSFMMQSSEIFKDTFDYLSLSCDSIIDHCQKYDLKDYVNAAEFNDADNHIWITPHNNLIISEQSYMYYIDFKDQHNFQIYMIDSANYSDELHQEYKDNFSSINFRDFLVLLLEEKIKNKTISEFDSLVFSFENKEVKFINPLYLKYFTSSIQYSLGFLKSEYDFVEKFPVDIYSYDYQRKYFQHKYNMSEFKFLCQSLLTLGGGFDYDQDKGLFYSCDIEYISNIPDYASKEPVTINQVAYFYPANIKKLDKDWTQGLKYLVEQLENNHPEVLIFEERKYKTQEEAFTNVIKYFKKVIKQNS